MHPHPKQKKAGAGIGAKKKKKKNATTTTTDLPLRPYTEYNIFFRIERARMLQAAGVIDDEIVGSLDPTHVDPLEFPRPAGYESVSLPPYWYSRLRSASTKKERRKHRKREGGMDLKTLSGTVAASWRGAHANVVGYCRRLAKAEMGNYNYNAQQAKGMIVNVNKRQPVKITNNAAATTTTVPSNELGKPPQSLGVVSNRALSLEDYAAAGRRASKNLKALSKKPTEPLQVISDEKLFLQLQCLESQNKEQALALTSCDGLVNECTNNETITKSLQHHQLRHAYMRAQLSLGNYPLSSVPSPSSIPNDGRFACFASAGSGGPLPPAMNYNKRNFARRVSSPPALFAGARPVRVETPRRPPWPLQQNAREGTRVRPEKPLPSHLHMDPSASTFPNDAAVERHELAQQVTTTAMFAVGAIQKPEEDADTSSFGVFREVSFCSDGPSQHELLKRGNSCFTHIPDWKKDCSSSSSDEPLPYQQDDELLLETRRVGDFSRCFNHHVPDWKKEDADLLLDMLELPMPGSSSDYGDCAGPDRADCRRHRSAWSSMQITSDTNFGSEKSDGKRIRNHAEMFTGYTVG